MYLQACYAAYTQRDCICEGGLAGRIYIMLGRVEWSAFVNRSPSIRSLYYVLAFHKLYVCIMYVLCS